MFSDEVKSIFEIFELFRIFSTSISFNFFVIFFQVVPFRLSRKLEEFVCQFRWNSGICILFLFFVASFYKKIHLLNSFFSFLFFSFPVSTNVLWSIQAVSFARELLFLRCCYNCS